MKDPARTWNAVVPRELVSAVIGVLVLREAGPKTSLLSIDAISTPG